jgi:general secretion pathway protein G
MNVAASARKGSFPSTWFLIIVALIFIWAVVMPRHGSYPGQVTVARVTLDRIQTGLEAYHDDTRGYPNTATGLDALLRRPLHAANWQGPYLDKIPKDPWRHDYIYVCPGIHNPSSFDLSSMGPDGKLGDDDDIRN